MPEWIVKYWVEELFALTIAGFSIVIKHLYKKLKEEKKLREDETRLSRTA